MNHELSILFSLTQHRMFFSNNARLHATPHLATALFILSVRSNHFGKDSRDWAILICKQVAQREVGKDWKLNYLHSQVCLLAYNEVDLNRTFRFPTLYCKFTTQALPPTCSAVGLPRMERVAEKAIRDVAYMSTHQKITWSFTRLISRVNLVKPRGFLCCYTNTI